MEQLSQQKSGFYQIGDNEESISLVSGDITVEGNNSGNIVLTKGDIHILGENGGNISKTGGLVLIEGNNCGEIDMTSGDIKIIGDNSGSILNRDRNSKHIKGYCVVTGSNIGKIEKSNGIIMVGENDGEIKNSHGETIVTGKNNGTIKTATGIIIIKDFLKKAHRHTSNEEYEITIGREPYMGNFRIGDMVSKGTSVQLLSALLLDKNEFQQPKENKVVIQISSRGFVASLIVDFNEGKVSLKSSNYMMGMVSSIDFEGKKKWIGERTLTYKKVGGIFYFTYAGYKLQISSSEILITKIKKEKKK